ncbi:MAG: phage shock protein PspC (stress-responsive transcriptional regulator) [Candidatus Paceibacteria bacterium]|jgi:phage shock protein PspC (stress-responsive transcriptional regulator)
MKKVINITIGNTIFLIEEGAYSALSNYLDEIKSYFSRDEEGDDVIEDIENSIAEKLISKGFNTDKAITEKDVENIISLMGTVEELSGEGSEEDFAPEDKTTSNSKRLYRDTEDVVIGGVASGIARYFSVDPVITRVLFVIFGIFGGFGLPAYILLWIIVPAADTASKKIRMGGGKATISEIETFVKKKIDEVPKSKWKKFFSFPFLILKKLATFLFKVIKKTGPILSGIIGVSISLVSLISLFAFSISFIVLVSGGGLTDPLIAAVVGILSAGTLGFATMISLYLLVVIPLISITLFGIMLIRRKKFIGWVGSIILFALWFLSANIISATALTSIDDIRDGISQAQTQVKALYLSEEYTDMEFSSVDISGNTEVKIIKGEVNKVVVEGSERALEALQVKSEDGQLKIYRDNEFYICIFYCSELFSKTIITITTPELDGVSFSGNVKGEMDEFTVEDFSAKFSGGASFLMNAVTKSFDLRIIGSGDLTLVGSTEDLSIKLSGSSKINGYDFSAKNASVKSSGSAKVQLSVEDSLDVRSSGSTKVAYIDLGEVVVTERISGSGSIEEVSGDMVQ